MEIELLDENERIPAWLSMHLSGTCGCGAPIVVNEALTRVWCINPKCPHHMKYKVKQLASDFNVVGVGPATALDLILQNRMECHLQALPVWLNEKPLVELWEVGKYAMIYGFKGKWEEIVKGCSTFEEFYTTKPVPLALQKCYEYLTYCEKFFRVKAVRHGIHEVRVWMTGSFPGYRNRLDFLADINEKFGDCLSVRDNGTVQRGTQYLVKPLTAADRSKTTDALMLGIPIVTPEKFMEIITMIYYSVKN